MSKKLFLILMITTVLSSCTVYRTMSFNADYSGSMDSRVDMTGLVTMMGENGGGGAGMGSMGDLSQLEKTKTLLENTPGVSNVKVSYDSTGILYTSYDFNSVETLNKAMSSSGSSMDMLGGSESDKPGKSKITFKGKRFYMEEIDKKTLKGLQSAEKKKEMAQMEMLLASSEFNTTINLPSAVKKVSYKNASITNEKSVNFVIPFKEYLSKNYKPITILLK